MNGFTSGRSMSVPTFYVAPQARAPQPVATGTEAQLDRDADERATIAVLDALATLKDWAGEDAIRARMPSRYAWQAAEVLARLLEAGKVERRTMGLGRQWRRA